MAPESAPVETLPSYYPPPDHATPASRKELAPPAASLILARWRDSNRSYTGKTRSRRSRRKMARG
jgi:hypothetical protein